MNEHRSNEQNSHDVAPGSPNGGGGATLLSPESRSGAGRPGGLTWRASFDVDGEPVGQPRVRFSRKSGGVYTPTTADAWKVAVIMAAKRQRPAAMLDGPISCRIVFRFARPKAHFHAGRRSGELRASAPFWHAGKPDIDNLAKSTLDALNHAGIWFDDAQVCELLVSKCYSDKQGAFIHLEEHFVPERQ